MSVAGLRSCDIGWLRLGGSPRDWRLQVGAFERIGFQCGWLTGTLMGLSVRGFVCIGSWRGLGGLLHGFDASLRAVCVEVICG